ncbi:MAG: hypothetical protein J6L81_04970 [Clostridia bacterium]|nr:hypothetical protein [Clostridia bacterium]
MKKVVSLILALTLVFSCFSFIGCDFLDSLAAEGEEESDLPAAVGKWDLVANEDSAAIYLKIEEDGSVDGMFVTTANIGVDGDIEYSYNFKRDKIEMEYSGVSFLIDCEVDGDFLVVDLSSINPDADPMVLRRHGTDGDVIEYYYDNFDDEVWDYDYTYDGPVFSDLKYTVPEKFTYSNDNSSGIYNTYVLESFLEGKSSDSSSIVISDAVSAFGFSSLTSDSLEAQYEAELGVDVTVDEYDDELTIAGFNAIRIQISFKYSGINIVQVQYLINADGELYTYTLTQPEKAKWIDKFDESVQNIEAIYE